MCRISGTAAVLLASLFHVQVAGRFLRNTYERGALDDAAAPAAAPAAAEVVKLGKSSEVPYAVDGPCVKLSKMVMGLDPKKEKPAAVYKGKSRMKHEVCYFFCSEQKSLYMALKRGKECVCFDKYEVKETGTCDWRCKGNPKQKCGGKESFEVHTLYMYTSKGQAAHDKYFKWVMNFNAKGCFSLAPKGSEKYHLARPSTTSKKALVPRHVKPAPKSAPPKTKKSNTATGLLLLEGNETVLVDDSLEEPVDDSLEWLDENNMTVEVELEDPLLEEPWDETKRLYEDAQAFALFKRQSEELNISLDLDPTPEASGPKPILGYLLDIKITADELNYMYVKVVHPVDGTKEGALSLEACMFPGYFIAERNNAIELRKIVMPAKGDHSVTSSPEDLAAATFQTEPDFFEKDTLALWKEDKKTERLKFLTADASGISFKLFEDGAAYANLAAWKPSYASQTAMICPPNSFKVEFFTGALPAKGSKTDPTTTRCSMTMDYDDADLRDLGYTAAYSAKVKGNMAVESDGYYRVMATKEMSVKVEMDNTQVVKEKSIQPVTSRKDLYSVPMKMNKGIHKVEDLTEGLNKAKGFALKWQRVCPETKKTSNGATVTFPVTVTSAGEVGVTCPATHNGKLVMRCDAGAAGFTKMRGECIEKVCPAVDVPSDSVKVKFEEVKQNTGKVTKQCPKTHNGALTMICAKEMEAWGDVDGACVEKTCDQTYVKNGGAEVVFLETKQGSGEIVMDCPSTHKGKLRRTCAALAEQWSNPKGKCTEKTCPKTVIQTGGVEVTFPISRQTTQAEQKCPATHHGALKMNCPPSSDAWAPSSGECVEKECKGHSMTSGEATISFPTVKQGTGKVMIRCPDGFAGQVTKTCAAESDKWDKVVLYEGKAQVGSRCVRTTPHFIVKKGAICKCGGTSLGKFGTSDECAVAAEKASQSFFVHSKSTQECLSQTTRSARCKEGFKSDSKYDFYGRSPLGFDAFDNAKCGTGGGKTVKNRAECTDSCHKDKGCGCTVYFRPPGCAEDSSDCKGERKCWTMSDCDAAKCPQSDGFMTFTKTRCPATTVNSGGVTVDFKHAWSGAGKVSMSCPASHHGKIEMDCVENAIVWSAPKGECVEKTCPAQTKTSGGVTLSFPKVTQNNKHKIICPPTHLGSVEMACPKNRHSWSSLKGNCRMKKCPNTSPVFGGARVVFGSVRQGTGTVTKKCPSTHTGVIETTCASNTNAWSGFKGTCKMKQCPRTRTDYGIVFGAVNNGRGRVYASCPNGYTGSVSMSCDRYQSRWTSKRNTCRKLCPKFGGRQHGANWWRSFDYTGWSTAPGPITGLFRTGNQWLWNIEAAAFRHYERAPQGIQCKRANWWSSFDRRGWSHCPTGYFMHGLFRNGRIGRWYNNQLYHIEEAYCCKPKQSPRRYGHCRRANWWGSFDRQGWSMCPTNYAVTGFYRNGGGHHIYRLEEAMCCTIHATSCSTR